MKLANIVMGLSVHGGKYACLYCESVKSTEPGELRTFGSLGNYNVVK